jgi:hypothetical protein
MVADFHSVSRILALEFLSWWIENFYSFALMAMGINLSRAEKFDFDQSGKNR